MSQHIEYYHLAVEYHSIDLIEHNKGWHESLCYDNYLCITLSGPNNLYVHGFNNRYVRKRDWGVITSGGKIDCIRDACEFAKDCEGGGLRRLSDRYTKPENYIRMWRNVLESAVSFEEIDLNINARLRFHRDDMEEHQKEMNELSMYVQPTEDKDGVFWLLDLKRIDHATMYFKYKHIDKRSAWNIIKVDGPCYGHSLEMFFKRGGRMTKTT